MKIIYLGPKRRRGLQLNSQESLDGTSRPEEQDLEAVNPIHLKPQQASRQTDHSEQLKTDSEANTRRCPTPAIKRSARQQHKLERAEEASRELMRYGCVPCYPVKLKLLPHELPARYQVLVDYWATTRHGGADILAMQLQDWKNFYKIHYADSDHSEILPGSWSLEQRLSLWRKYKFFQYRRFGYLLAEAEKQLQNYIELSPPDELEEDFIERATRHCRRHEKWITWIRRQIRFIETEIALKDTKRN